MSVYLVVFDDNTYELVDNDAIYTNESMAQHAAQGYQKIYGDIAVTVREMKVR